MTTETNTPKPAPRRWRNDRREERRELRDAHKAGFDAAMHGQPANPPEQHATAYRTGYAEGETMREQAPAESPLDTIRRHAESHRALAESDAYSAQEAPRLEAALATLAELIEVAGDMADRLDDAGRSSKALRAILARAKGGAA